MSTINIQFDDAVLKGTGSVTVEHGKLYADGPYSIEKADVLYLYLEEGLIQWHGRLTWVEPGSYVVCRGGLYKRIEVGD